jgi:hypothetical protein
MHHSDGKGSCNGKATYRTIGEVTRAVRNLARRVLAHKHHVRPYHCNACQGYHVTGMETGEVDTARFRWRSIDAAQVARASRG